MNPKGNRRTKASPGGVQETLQIVTKTIMEQPRSSSAAIGSSGQPSLSQTQAVAAKLRPKEHGAYAILGIPVVSALIAGGLTLSGFCVAIAAVAGFLAHEPLLVAWGHRGRRAQRSTPTAKLRLVVLLLIALVAGCTALISGSESVRWSLIACLVIASIVFAVAMAGRHRTLGAQLLGVVGLSLPCVPILIAGGISVSGAMMVWAAWLLGFSATTIAVRSVIAAQKREPRWAHTTILCVISLLIGAGAVLRIYWPLVTLPMIVPSWYLLIAPPPAKYLKRVGWTLVICTIATAALMVYRCPV